MNILLKKLYIWNKEKLSDRYWENCQKIAKLPNSTLFWPFGPWKILKSDSIKSNFFRQFISTLFGNLHAKIQKKLSNSFWENCLKVKNEPNLTFKRYPFFQQNPYFYITYIDTFIRKLHAKKEKKVIKQFLRNQAFKWKVDDNNNGRTNRH